MIFDSHMHVGSFESMFGVSLDRDGLEALMQEHGIGSGVVFHPDNAYVREVVESIPGMYGLVWSNRACRATSPQQRNSSPIRSSSG